MGHLAYMNSKLMQAISSVELNTRLPNAGANVRTYLVHPGTVYTDMVRNALGDFPWLFRTFLRVRYGV